MSSSLRTVWTGSSNPAKRDRLRWLLEGLGLQVRTPEGPASPPAAGERGRSPRANAVAKALAWSRVVRGAAIASDGVLFIPALGRRWAPLRTGRFAGPRASDRERIDALLRMMAGLAGEERTAYWAEAVALAYRGRLRHCWQAESPRGAIARSYDPKRVVAGLWAFSVWYLPQFGKTYAELAPIELQELDDHWRRLRAQMREFFL